MQQFGRTPWEGKLLGVRIAEVDLDPLIGGLVRIDLVGLTENAAREKLLQGISRKRAKPTAEPAFPGERPRTVAEKPRFPGALPPIWNVPLHRNPNFTGRTALLERLHEALTSGEPAALTQAIAGLGGIGKTQLALEYAYRHASEYQTVWWVRADEPATLASDYAAMASRLGVLEKGHAADVPGLVEMAKAWLERHGGWLLVFDNAQAPERVRDYLPQGATGHAIVTSRNPSWRGTATALEMPVLERGESVAFLLKRSGQEDHESADALAEALGDFPLALEQAGAYIEENAETLRGYFDLYQSHPKRLLSEFGKPADYPDTVATTWDLSIEQVREASLASVDLLNLLAFVAPEGIPKAMLQAGAEHLPKALGGALGDPSGTNDLIRPLRAYSLVEVSGDLLSVHRLVQVVTRDRLEAAEQQAWAGTAVQIVDGYFHFDQSDPATWEPSGALPPHALAAAGHAEPVKAAPDTTARLLNRAGLYLKQTAQLDPACDALQRALAIDEAVYGPDHPNVAIDVNNLGFVLRALGEPRRGAGGLRAGAGDRRGGLRPGPSERGDRRQQPGGRAAGPGGPRPGSGGLRAGAGDRRGGLRPGPSERGEKRQQPGARAAGPGGPRRGSGGLRAGAGDRRGGLRPGPSERGDRRQQPGECAA